MFTTHYEIKIALSVQQTKLLKLLLEVHTKLSFWVHVVWISGKKWKLVMSVIKSLNVLKYH